MNKLGETIKAMRKQNGLTQKEFGEIMTVSDGYISKVEHGKEKPTEMFIKLFCLAYSIDKDSLKY